MCRGMLESHARGRGILGMMLRISSNVEGRGIYLLVMM